MKRTVPLFVSIVGMLLSVTLMPGASLGEMLGASAPDFVLTDSEGRPFQLSKKLDKHVVLVHMQVFCYECRQEVPLINQIVKEYLDIHIVAISTGNDEAEVSEFKKVFDVHYPILPDPDKVVLKKYSINSVPHIDVIDKTGTIRYRGEIHSLAEFKSILDGILQK